MKKLATALALACMTLACDKDDEFEDVEPVKAPAATSPAEPVENPQAENLPEGHPPMGESGKQQGAEKAGSPVPEPEVTRFASPDQYGKTGPLRWNAPDDWQAARPATSMRLAEYIIPSSSGEPAVLSVFHFGPGGGGGVDANVTRWTGQFKGGPAPERGEKMVGGMKVHTVDATGSYDPGMAGGNAPAKKDHRMRGAIVESPAGLYFFKLVGPQSVVNEQDEAWDAFVESFARE